MSNKLVQNRIYELDTLDIFGHYKKGLKQDIWSGEELSSAKTSRKILNIALNDIIKEGKELNIKAKEAIQKSEKEM